MPKKIRKMMPKKLRERVSLWVLRHVTVEKRKIIQFLLISPTFLANFIDDKIRLQYGVSKIFKNFEFFPENDFHSPKCLFYRKFGKIDISFKLFTTFLQIFNFGQINIHVDRFSRYTSTNQIFISLFKNTKVEKSVGLVILTVDRRFYLPILDTISNKFPSVTLKFDFYVILPKLTLSIDQIKLTFENKVPYLHQLFKLKTKRLELKLPSNWMGLYSLCEHGPFDANSMLNNLKIQVYLDMFPDCRVNYYVNFEECLRRYRIGLEYLRDMNQNIQLDIEASINNTCARTYAGAAAQRKPLTEKICSFIDLAVDLGLNVNLSEMNTVVYVANDVHSNETIGKFVAEAQLIKCPKRYLHYKFESEHRGIKFSIIYQINAPFLREEIKV